MTMGRRVLRALLREDFLSFLERAYSTIHPGSPFHRNWHHDAIAYQLQRIREGRCARLIINQPPRSLKSITVSVAYVAWLLGKDPGMRIMVVSYNREFAADLHRQFRAVVKSDWYRELFPQVKWAKETDVDFVTTRGGGRFATSVGGTVTGRGGDLIIVDDPMSAGDTLSEPARQRVIEFFTTSLVARLNDKRRQAIVVVMQRLHEGDLCGYLLAQDGWDHLTLPAIAGEESRITLTHGRVKVRHEGEVLHSHREDRLTLDRLSQEMGSPVFAAQYQQAPIPMEGNLVRREWLRWYDWPIQRLPRDEIVLSCDIATAVGPHNDYSVCLIWLLRDKRAYLIDVWRGRLQFPTLREKIRQLAATHCANRILIEDAGPGLQLLQDLWANTPPGMPRPVAVRPQGSKQDRMAMQSARFEDGTALLPREAPWLALYLQELLGFPQTKHDDQVDATSQFLFWHTNVRRQARPWGGVIIVTAARRDPFSSSDW